MKIKRFKKRDAILVHEIIKDCIQNVPVGKHTQKGIQLQIEANSPEHLIERSKSIRYFVAVIDNEVIGICGYDSEKIHTLFISPEYQRRGYGKLLLKKILHEAKRDGLRRIIVWSTVFAVNFYKSFGFTIIREIQLPEGSNDITLVEMQKDFM
jgi:N-acetylglutamate synthase-like GNAT family acetyltransferase